MMIFPEPRGVGSYMKLLNQNVDVIRTESSGRTEIHMVNLVFILHGHSGANIH